MALRHAHLLAVRGRDAGAFLTTVLQRVQTEVGHVRRFGMTEDAEDAALVLEFVHGTSPRPRPVPGDTLQKYRSIAVDHTRFGVAHRHVDRQPAVDGDAQQIAARFSDDSRRYARRRRLLQHLSDMIGRQRDDDARGRFAEQRRRLVHPRVGRDAHSFDGYLRARCRRRRNSTRRASTARPPSEQS